MTDSYADPQQNGGQAGRDGGRDSGRRRGGNREGGGFRIRLSDNEMRSARALQEAFNLRSTVAVLGFAVRSLGQMLEDGQLDALIEQQRSQSPRSGGRRSDGGRSGARGDGAVRGNRPDPFARPSKPQVAPAETTAATDVSTTAESIENSAESSAPDTAETNETSTGQE